MSMRSTAIVAGGLVVVALIAAVFKGRLSDAPEGPEQASLPAAGIVPPEEDPGRANAEELAALAALGYVEHTEETVDPNTSGVIVHLPDAMAGLNMRSTHCALFDMEGRLLASWPGLDFCVPLEDGTIVGIDETGPLSGVERRTSKDELIWRVPLPVHHELALTARNTMLVPTKEIRTYQGRRVEFDNIVEIDMQGRFVQRWSSFNARTELRKHHKRSRLDRPPQPDEKPPNASFFGFGGDYDYYHLNSIQSLPRTPLHEKGGPFEAGNWLICLPFAKVFVILHRDTQEILWSMRVKAPGGIHTPRLLPSGTILYYDNGRKKKREFSRLVEIDPITSEIVWTYSADSKKDFFSHQMGNAQRLANGNTLVADPVIGRAFEVTPDKKIVWEWFNPDLTEKGQRMTVSRINRYRQAWVLERWL